MPAQPLLEVWVQVRCNKADVSDALWHSQQFKTRLTLMRRMYDAFKKSGKDIREIKR
jgi:hypothetical protein